MLYAFEISNGPIWDIKFHPSVSINKDKIGTLAVTTADQDILVFSLSHGNTQKGIYHIQPNIICKIADEKIICQDYFLLQATRISWCYNKSSSSVLTAGYVNGYVALWNLDEIEEADQVLPNMVIQSHREAITAIDLKMGDNGKMFLLTASLGREIKLYVIFNGRYEEFAINYTPSRTTCAQFWNHWAAYISGNDSSYATGILTSRQPFDFATKNTHLMNANSTIISLDINHWTNTVVFTTDVGDVLSCTPNQLVNNNPKDKWMCFKNSILSFTDLEKDDSDKVGIIFNDIKVWKIYLLLSCDF